MVRYWKIRAGSGGYLWDAWSREKKITIGWDVGEIVNSDWNEIRDLIEENYDESPGKVASMLQKFVGTYDEGAMDQGDLAIVLGSGTVLDIVKVGDYKYNKKGLPEAKSHVYQRTMNRFNVGPVRIRDLPQTFQQGSRETSLHLVPTLNQYYIEEDTFNELITAIEELEPIDIEESLADLSEDSVQGYIFRHFKELDASLVSIEREYSTRVGDADFYAVDQHDNVVVIEVKAGTAKDNVVGQILGYMNSIREKESRPVRGMIVAEGFTERVKEAIESDKISLVTFRTKLLFSEI